MDLFSVVKRSGFFQMVGLKGSYENNGPSDQLVQTIEQYRIL